MWSSGKGQARIGKGWSPSLPHQPQQTWVMVMELPLINLKPDPLSAAGSILPCNNCCVVNLNESAWWLGYGQKQVIMMDNSLQKIFFFTYISKFLESVAVLCVCEKAIFLEKCIFFGRNWQKFIVFKIYSWPKYIIYIFHKYFFTKIIKQFIVVLMTDWQGERLQI